MHLAQTAKPSIQPDQRLGFTIVELLIVIVVIGILATITMVAYNGISARASDSRRLDDIVKIRQALELYRIDSGTYPMAINSGMANGSLVEPGSGWESSAYGGQATWLNRLKPYLSQPALDPTNDSSHFYYYYFYLNNPGLCGATTPNCYVLGIAQLDAGDALQMPDINQTGGDSWRNTVGVNRPVWHGAY